ncbi:MAG: M50 family metallopeptidase [Bacilli bacterium]|jgi:regulator of sigma E protease
MSFLDWFVGILLFILALGLLVLIHELGHLATAKMFNVYCLEFSIGFGPKIFSRRGAKKETKFSLRWFPLGGYVSMYGEGVELDEGQVIPESRSIQGIKKWKQAIVFAAGIILNFVLGFTLIFISSACFPHTQITSNLNITESSLAQTAGLQTNDRFFLIPVTNENSVYYLIDDSVSITNESGVTNAYVAVCNPTYTTIKDPSMNECIYFYEQDALVDAVIDYGEVQIPVSYHAPKFVSTPLFATPKGECSFTAKFTTITITQNSESGSYEYSLLSHPITVSSYAIGESTYAWQDVGISFQRYVYWYNIGEVFANSWNQFVYANTAIAKAIGGLFTGASWSNIGGPLAIAKQVTLVNANYGFGMYIYYIGFLSINLALLNLMPFPGLDGWSLVVVAFEAITKKKVSNKAKTIMSYIGLAILFILAIFIAIKDIIGFIV